MVGETEVIFWRTWRGKRYHPNGRVLLPLGPGPVVELPIHSQHDSTESSTGTATTATMSTQGSTDASSAASEYQFYHHEDIIPLNEAIARQQREDPPPVRQYVHTTSMQPITMGEWMLCSDRHGRLANHDWQKRIHDQVRVDGAFCQSKKNDYFMILPHSRLQIDFNR